MRYAQGYPLKSFDGTPLYMNQTNASGVCAPGSTIAADCAHGVGLIASTQAPAAGFYSPPF